MTSAIFKEPVMGSVKVGFGGLEGDQQADLWVHGGKKKPFMPPLFDIHFGRMSCKKILSPCERILRDWPL